MKKPLLKKGEITSVIEFRIFLSLPLGLDPGEGGPRKGGLRAAAALESLSWKSGGPRWWG